MNLMDNILPFYLFLTVFSSIEFPVGLYGMVPELKLQSDWSKKQLVALSNELVVLSLEEKIVLICKLVFIYYLTRISWTGSFYGSRNYKLKLQYIITGCHRQSKNRNLLMLSGLVFTIRLTVFVYSANVGFLFYNKRRKILLSKREESDRFIEIAILCRLGPKTLYILLGTDGCCFCVSISFSFYALDSLLSQFRASTRKFRHRLGGTKDFIEFNDLMRC